MKATRALAAILWLSVAAPPPAAAQQEPGPPAAAAPAATGSFASEFFVSWKADPRSQEKSVEIVGSLIIWFLLAMSLVSTGLIGHMALANQRSAILPPALLEEVRRHMAAGRYRDVIELTGRSESFFGQVLGAALREAGAGFGAVVRSLELTSEELTTIRLRRIEYLNVVGQVSPMIGLFGTVYGMILAFHSIVAAGGNADPVLLAGGIGTALVTTFWGLIVAIPALAGYAIIRNRTDELTTDATRSAEELINQFRPRPRPKPEPAGEHRPTTEAQRAPRPTETGRRVVQEREAS
jgi:biopolymer transport protein ExbB